MSAQCIVPSNTCQVKICQSPSQANEAHDADARDAGMLTTSRSEQAHMFRFASIRKLQPLTAHLAQYLEEPAHGVMHLV